jgi:hypothetical protein
LHGATQIHAPKIALFERGASIFCDAVKAVVDIIGGYAVGGGGDFPVVNDYRQLAVIRDPISRSSGNIATEVTLDSTYTLNLTNVSGTFALDELVKGDDTAANAYVVSANVTGTNVILRYITPENLYYGNVNFIAGEILRGNTSLATGNISSIIAPEIQHNTGKVLYVENRNKITRQADQAENIHIVIEF